MRSMRSGLKLFSDIRLSFQQRQHLIPWGRREIEEHAFHACFGVLLDDFGFGRHAENGDRNGIPARFRGQVIEFVNAALKIGANKSSKRIR